MNATLTLDMMIPDLLKSFPRARRVLDAYGLRGCGGPLGPAESLGFFARTHGVEPDRLLKELTLAADAPTADADGVQPVSVADTIYRRYFLAGILVVLTAGASWGAVLLWQIAVAGKFTGASLQQINAHGHAQIYGWVGLFVMGFAYQAFPRLWHTTLVAPAWAVVTFGLMLAGLVVRTVGMVGEHSIANAPITALAGGAAEALAVLIFAAQLLLTWRRSLARFEPYVAFCFAAVVFFIAQAGLDLWHTHATMTATSREDLLWHVATYQAPLRDLQVHGLALFMILGVSMRMLPSIFDLPVISRRRAMSAFWILSSAVVGESVLFIVYRWTGNHMLAATLLVPWLMLAVGCAMIALPWKLWRPLPTADRSGKFVRAAYGWLGLSLVMLLLPVYQVISRIPFSHAYYGAIRHAITVGFVSLMIMGMAAKVVPTLNGFDPRKLSTLWPPFVLVNAGCFMRVSLQTLTDWHPAFFRLVGVSGVLEVTGLAVWGAHLALIMLQGRREQARPGTPAPTPTEVTPDLLVSDVLSFFPATLAVFERHGFTLLRNPVARRTIARGVTVRSAASFRGLPLERLVADLNDATASSSGKLHEEPMNEANPPADCHPELPGVMRPHTVG